MDSEHRHELKENDLKAALQDWRGLWDRYGTFATLVILIVVLIFAATRIFGYMQSTTHESAWSELFLTSTPEGMAGVAEEHSVRGVQLLALLRGADLFLNEAVFPPELTDDAAGGDDDAADADELRDQRLTRAETMYRQVLELAEAGAFRANALLGLAAVAETRLAWDAAAAHYDEAESVAEAADLPELAGIASHRRGMLDTLKQPVTIADDPPPAAAEGPDAGGLAPGTLPSGLGTLDELIESPFEIDFNNTVIDETRTISGEDEDGP